VAAGHICAAIGTQTNGSVLRPAAYCGVVGFKPTLGAIPYDGVYLFSATLDTVGTFARTVADAALLASVLADAGRIAPAIAPLAKAPRPGLSARFSVVAHGWTTRMTWSMRPWRASLR
jgi:Asp-tRNA(Asn)/Glu-tRNA(Gln) amidotransferase A subunit family amidase